MKDPGLLAFLDANNAAYEGLVLRARSLHSTGDLEGALRAVQKAAYCAALFHGGRYADGAIENIALAIGMSLHDRASVLPLPQPQPRTGRRRVLHVATAVAAIGGHTRMINHWVRADRGSLHSLVLVDQGEQAVPVWLEETLRDAGSALHRLAGPDLRAKALHLRTMARHEADLVVLHTDVQDAVPVVAFAKADGPPVALLNHADHQFWLGSSVADLVISLRTAGAANCKDRRGAAANVVLPIPIEIGADRSSRTAARRDLGIGNDAVVLLSAGRREKYRPCGDQDFLETAGKILDRNPTARLHLVGETRSGIARYLRRPVHERITFLGAVEDFAAWRHAADVYLESFPFGSNTALLEAASCGLPIVPAYAPLSPLLVANNDSLLDVLVNPPSEDAYVNRACELIREPARARELGEQSRQRVARDHVGAGWTDKLEIAYRVADRLGHRPRPLPLAACSRSAADIALSTWRATGYSDQRLQGAEARLLHHTATVARFVGDYRQACKLSAAVVFRHGTRPDTWRFLAGTLRASWRARLEPGRAES